MVGIDSAWRMPVSPEARRELIPAMALRLRFGQLHPGAVKTAMAQQDAYTEPADAARALLALIDALRAEHSGRFLDVDSLRTGRDHAW